MRKPDARRPISASCPSCAEVDVASDKRRRYGLHMSSEIIFEVREDEADGGYTASALGHDVFTEADSLEELRENVRAAVQCHFGEGGPGPVPGVIRLHFVRDEVLAA
jgi:hypothetical protein